MAIQTGTSGALKTLWGRAPVWRFSLMSAALVSILFILYPPDPAGGRDRTTPAPVNDMASYAGQVVPPAPATPVPTAVAANVTPSVAPAPTVQTTAIAAPASKPAQDTKTAIAPASSNTAAKSAPAASPKTADLSLVTAGAKPTNDISGVDPALMGHVYSGSVQVDGYRVPLPSGNWVSLANTSIKLSTANGFGFFLGKIEHKRLTALVKGYVLRSKDKPGAGFDVTKGCTDADPSRNFVSIEEMVSHGNQACWRIHSYYTPAWQKWADRTENIEQIERAAAGDMQAKGVTYAQDFVDVRFSRFTTWGGMEVHYMFSPAEEGISSNTVLSYADMDWRANNIVRYPEKVAYVNNLEKWGTSFWPKFKAGFAEGERADNAMVKTSTPDTPPNAQANTVASAMPAKASAPQTGTISKAALSGKQLILAGFYSVNPDCTSGGVPTVRVTEAPKHGAMTMVEETGFPGFPKENPRNACNAMKLPVANVKYQSEPDYVGNDAVTVEVIFPDGIYRTQTINIVVK